MCAEPSESAGSPIRGLNERRQQHPPSVECTLARVAGVSPRWRVHDPAADRTHCGAALPAAVNPFGVGRYAPLTAAAAALNSLAGRRIKGWTFGVDTPAVRVLLAGIVSLALFTPGCAGDLDTHPSADIPEGHVECPYEPGQDCGPATGNPAIDNDDSNKNGIHDAAEPSAHTDSDGDHTVDLYDQYPHDASRA